MVISTRTLLEKKGSLKQGLLHAASIKRRSKQSYSLRQILVGPFAIEMQLTKFICHKTEDFIGRDDLSLDIFVDDITRVAIRIIIHTLALFVLHHFLLICKCRLSDGVD